MIITNRIITNYTYFVVVFSICRCIQIRTPELRRLLRPSIERRSERGDGNGPGWLLHTVIDKVWASEECPICLLLNKSIQMGVGGKHYISNVDQLSLWSKTL
jgi:hypothetical protein